MINFAIIFINLENLFLISEGMTRTKNELGRNEDFMKLYNHLECMFAYTRGTSANGFSTIQKGVVFLLKFYVISLYKIDFEILLHRAMYLSLLLSIATGLLNA